MKEFTTLVQDQRVVRSESVDNEAKLGPITLKKWTTTSEITAYEPGEVFEFVTEILSNL